MDGSSGVRVFTVMRFDESDSDSRQNKKLNVSNLLYADLTY